MIHRRRAKSHEPSESTHPATETKLSQKKYQKLALALLLTCGLLISLTTWRITQPQTRSPTKDSLPKSVLTSQTTQSDDEKAITEGYLPHEDVIPPAFQEEVMTCMPTVSRSGTEYISNAIKSWRLATNQSTSMRRLAIFIMDIPTNESHTTPIWLQKVFADPSPRLPSWLSVHTRHGTPIAPRKHTLGDSATRVTWRSKEAQDYSQVLSRCRQMTTGGYVLVMQDDVLLTRGVGRLTDWADARLTDGLVKDAAGQERMQRVCGGSLFDLATPTHEGVDGHTLDSSNMVARVWRTDFSARIVRFLNANFDEAPVDWLADRLCRSARRVTLVMEPNAVRHRGAISSFTENKREGTLT